MVESSDSAQPMRVAPGRVALHPGRLACHTQTFKPWSLTQCIDRLGAAGVGGVSIWRHTLDELGVQASARLVRASGLKVPALVRGGFFVASEPSGRELALDDNRRAIDDAAVLGAEMLVLVVGAVPGVPLEEARKQVADALAALAPHASACGVKLAVEPLHPMYAADKSCINRLGDARRVCEQVDDPSVGVAVDVYHVWWDPELEAEIRRCGSSQRLFGFHICDWRVETRHMLTDRGMRGEGCIDLATIRRWMERAGFSGMVELEVFSEHHWGRDQDEVLAEMLAACAAHG